MAYQIHQVKKGDTIKAQTTIEQDTQIKLNEDNIQALSNGKIAEPKSEGTNGQVLTTDGKGGRTWKTIEAAADPAVIGEAVSDWLTDHPEATTTVADGSITEQKLASSVAQKVNAVTQLSDEIDSLENDLFEDTNIIDVSEDALMHPTGNGTIAFGNNNGFTYTRVTAGNNTFGFTFPTQAQKDYTLTLDVSDIASGDGMQIYVCPNAAYNTSGALAYESWIATNKAVTLNFTATTSESSLWFYVRYNTPGVKVSNVNISDGIIRYKLPDIMQYKGTEISVFSKIACVGDSITSGTFNYSENGNNRNVVEIPKYSYPTILTKMTGVETGNLGRGGSTTAEWYSYYENTDLSGYDAVIIMLGINDGVHTTAIADFTAAIKNIINKFKTENNGIKVFLSTIIPAYTDYDRKFDVYNAEIKRIAAEEYTDIYLLDINKYSQCKFYTPYAQGHLTAIGYQQLAHEFATLISYTIHTNLSAFQNVQFIGTNYTYNN